MLSVDEFLKHLCGNRPLLAMLWLSAAYRGIIEATDQSRNILGKSSEDRVAALARLGETRCQTPEEFKAWCQNIGHEHVLTTFLSYGEVGARRQGEIIRGLATPQLVVQQDVRELAKALAREMRDSSAETPVT